MPLLVDVVAARMKRPGGENDQLWRLLALLYQRQVRGVGQACVRQLVGAGCVLIDLWTASVHTSATALVWTGLGARFMQAGS